LRMLKQFGDLCKKYANLKPVKSPYLFEEVMEGSQVTVEGFCFNGKNTVIGITDSIFYPNSKISFRKFEYPSNLPKSVQREMTSVTKELISKLGYDHGFYNIEFFYNPANGDVKLIEFNPRMAYQFADLYEKVDGVNTFDVLLQMSLGRKPVFIRRKGKYKKAASFVLRSFEDGVAIRVPTDHEILNLSKVDKDVEVQVQAKQFEALSKDIFQDMESFRLMTMNIGANSSAELEKKYAYYKSLMPFTIDYYEKSAKTQELNALST
jgi:biotin carboxylase